MEPILVKWVGPRVDTKRAYPLPPSLSDWKDNYLEECNCPQCKAWKAHLEGKENGNSSKLG